MFAGLLLLFGVFPVKAQSWHQLSQIQRNQAIVNTGAQQIGAQGGQCKPWVQSVVSNASSGSVLLPATQPPPNDYMWYSNQYVVGLNTPPENVQFGWILQMKQFNGTPHTAIVAGISSYGITLLDSNWVAYEKVGTHFMTFQQFRNAFQYWSAYYIL